MKRILLILSLIISLCSSEDNFISICKNPTAEQKQTINALIDGYNEYRKLDMNKKQLNSNDSNICDILAKGKGFPDIRNKNISDISIIKYFSENEALDLSNNKITDITPLKYLTKLEKLEIERNRISKGVESLKNLPLKKLSISFSKDTDISPLGNIKTLEDVFIYGGKNYLTLNNLTNLNRVMITSVEITDLCKLTNFKSLERLSLSRNNLKNLKCIEKFTNLTYLDIENNPITDLTPLIKMDNLKELVIRDAPIEDISPLAKMKNLNSFHFSRTKIKYLSPLGKSKSLEFSEDSSERFIEEYFNRSLAWCSPKNMREVREGQSCFKEDGTLKPFYKRWLGI